MNHLLAIDDHDRKNPAPSRARWVRLLLLCGGLVAACGCESSEMVSAWQNPESRPRSFKKVLVVGISQREDVRRMFEDEFTRNLQTGGSQAIPSYTLIPASAEIDKAELQQAVARCGADAVLITRLIKREQRTSVSAGYPSSPGMYGDYYGYYHSSWGNSYSPPVTSTMEVVTTETRLYDARRAELVWTGTTESFDPSNMEKDLRSLVKAIAKDLRQRKLV